MSRQARITATPLRLTRTRRTGQSTRPGRGVSWLAQKAGTWRKRALVADNPSGWQAEQDGDQPASRPGRSPAQRFDVEALPGKRASYSLFEILRVVIVLLGLLAAGLFGTAEWLALRPPTYPTPVLATARVRPITVTPIPTPGGPVTPTLDISLSISTTPTPAATRTATPAPRRTTAPRPTATVPTATPSSLPAPGLLEPADGATLGNIATFRWQWTGPSLQPNQAFDLRIWSAQEELQGRSPRGAVAPVRSTEASVNLPFAPAIQDYGPGDYYWTVVVLEMSADGSSRVVSQWGERRRFVYH